MLLMRYACLSSIQPPLSYGMQCQKSSALQQFCPEVIGQPFAHPNDRNRHTLTMLHTFRQSDDAPAAYDPLTAPPDPSPPPSPVPSPLPTARLDAVPSAPPSQEMQDAVPPLPPRPEAPPPTSAMLPASIVAPATPSPPTERPPAPMSVFTGSSKPGRVITDAEREALKALGEHRETLKNEYNSRRVVAVCIYVYVCVYV